MSIKQKIINGVCIVVFILGIFFLYQGAAGVVSANAVYAAGEETYATAQAFVSENQVVPDEELVESVATEYGPLTIDFSGLQEINPDVCAWIYIEDTQVNYPVVISHDNMEYLNLTYDYRNSAVGAIFMDCANRPDFSCANTIIYGHNMRDGSMFKTVNYYADADYYQEHPYVWICTPTGQVQYGVIAAYQTDCVSDVYFSEFELGSEEYKAWLADVVASSYYSTNTPMDIDKPCVTLSTCVQSNSTVRMVLVLQPLLSRAPL